MNVHDVLNPIRQILGVAAIILALAALLKMTGFVPVRFSAMELAAVAIACGLAK
jgi:hypothetical protein